MGALLRLAMKGGESAFKLGKAGLFGGAATRIGIGAGLGAAYGMATNQYDDGDMAAGGVARAALYGGMLGGATKLFLPTLRNGKFGPMPLGLKAAGGMARSLPGMAKTGISGGATLAGMALRHPAAAVGLGVGAYSLNEYNKTPYGSPLSQSSVNQAFVSNETGPTYNKINRENAMLEHMDSGIMPMGGSMSGTQLRNRRLQQSTYGLTQGLHNGRHG